MSLCCPAEEPPCNQTEVGAWLIDLSPLYTFKRTNQTKGCQNVESNWLTPSALLSCPLLLLICLLLTWILWLSASDKHFLRPTWIWNGRRREEFYIYISIKKKHADKQLCIWLLPHNFFLHQAVLSKLFWVLICLENAMGKNKIMRKPNPSRRFSLSLRINHMKKKKEKKRGTNLRLQTQYMTVPWKQVTRQFKVYF